MNKYLLLFLSVCLLPGCNGSDDEKETPTPAEVTTLDITVASVTTDPDRPNYQASWSPGGNVYLFYSEEADLSYATVEGDGSQWPLMDVSTPYSPTVTYRADDGQTKVLHPVSAYGTAAGGRLDNHSSARYSQVHFDIPQLATTYGQVRKGSTVLVLIYLNDDQTKAWMGRALTLRRNHLIHVSLPDRKDRTFVSENEMSSRWWQVDEE